MSSSQRPETAIGMSSIKEIRNIIEKIAKEYKNRSWENSNGCRQTKQMIVKPNDKRQKKKVASIYLQLVT